MDPNPRGGTETLFFPDTDFTDDYSTGIMCKDNEQMGVILKPQNDDTPFEHSFHGIVHGASNYMFKQQHSIFPRSI
jgi:hypothetical protein